MSQEILMSDDEILIANLTKEILFQQNQIIYFHRRWEKTHGFKGSDEIIIRELRQSDMDTAIILFANGLTARSHRLIGRVSANTIPDNVLAEVAQITDPVYYHKHLLAYSSIERLMMSIDDKVSGTEYDLYLGACYSIEYELKSYSQKYLDENRVNLLISLNNFMGETKAKYCE